MLGNSIQHLYCLQNIDRRQHPSDWYEPLVEVVKVSRSTLTELITTGTAAVDMFTLVVVGNSSSKFVDGQMVTPRGYDWKS